jgi:acyl-CoA synthetase (AMP-forming)/AMP-acid ligase II
MLIELVREGAESAADRPFIVSADRSLSYGECVERSTSLACGLRAREIDRFACIGHPADLVPVLCASTAVGSEACVYPQGSDAATIAGCMERFDHRVLITADPLDVDGNEVIGLDRLADSHGELPPAPTSAPALILTTGTTGEPRGVRHDWFRLAGAVKQPGPADARWLLAYNLNQFAGVQVLIHVLISGATLVVPESNQPREAIGAMRELGVTHASATPTFWRFIAAQLDPRSARELPLQQITLGGEAVPAPVLEKLERLFPTARISQVYASNEFGSGVSVRDGSSGLPASVLERGEDADVQMRIVDGELHVRSRVGMLGYYGEPDVGDAWRPTGDLVEVHGDRIVFAGRTSEIINVGGVKVHPLPIEEIVGGVDGVELVHAYGRKSAVTGQIVAVDVVARDGVDTEDLEDRIHDACEGLVAAAQPRRIRFVDEIEVQGNKITRRGSAATR